MATTAILKVHYERLFPLVARFVAKRGGTLDEAKDVFHDALLVYYEHVRHRKLELQQNESAYIYGVARHLWTKRYWENQRHASLDQLMDAFEDKEESHGDWMGFEPEKATGAVTDRIARVLQAAGQKCMQLLTAFYYERLDMQELAQRFGFSGTRSATVQKFKCLQKVKQVVKDKSLQYEDFIG